VGPLKRSYSHVYIYKLYREYMRSKYGPGPWIDVPEEDRFYNWRARHFSTSELPSDVFAGINQAYKEDIRRRSRSRKPSGSRNRRRRKTAKPSRITRYPIDF